MSASRLRVLSDDGDSITYGRSIMQRRITAIVLAVAVVAEFSVFAFIGMSGPMATAGFFQLYVLFAVLMTAAMVALFWFRMLGRHEVRLWPTSKSYEALIGPPFSEKTLTGTYSDLKGFRIREDKGEEGTSYRIVLEWNEGRQKVTIGSFSKKGDAESALAEAEGRTQLGKFLSLRG